MRTRLIALSVILLVPFVSTLSAAETIKHVPKSQKQNSTLESRKKATQEREARKLKREKERKLEQQRYEKEKAARKKKIDADRQAAKNKTSAKKASKTTSKK